MTGTNRDDTHRALLMRVTQRIAHAWKRDAAAGRRFVTAVPWILPTGAPWRDRPDRLGDRPGVSRRVRRCVRGWWDRL